MIKGFKRSAGILLPIFSLPSKYGIGCFSKEAYDFVDRLYLSKQTYWQILPINPTGCGDSPYQSFSSFAGNPYFVDFEALKKEGLISDKELSEFDFSDSEKSVDYEKIKKSREKWFSVCFKNFDKSSLEFTSFCKKHKNWLDNYALYMALKEKFNDKEWSKWDEDIRFKKKSAVKKYSEELSERINYHKFIQFEFFKQWTKLKKYANSKKVKIIGDIPIYVAYDSADAWENPELFMLDKDLKPKLVAGCPPDEFSKKGQLWGNPVYNWTQHKATDYKWWIKRIKFSLTLYDVMRIDHFRGFESFYAIKYGRSDAVEGKWLKGPGYQLFKAIKEKLGDIPIIAEDLGFLTPAVHLLLKKTGFCGMKIFQFAFGGGKISDHIPYAYPENSVAYTGTHDNDTLMGWYEKLKKRDRLNVDEFIFSGEKNIGMIKCVLFSASYLAIIPMPDYFSLGSEARINIPSTVGNNWKWRMEKDAYNINLAKTIAKITKLSGRI